MLKKIFGQQVFGQNPGTVEAAPLPKAAAAPTDKAAGQPAPAQPVRRGRIDIKQAIDAHVHWRQRIEDYIQGKGALGAGDGDDHECCDLGQWLNGEGRKRYGDLQLFEDLRVAHEHLHERVGVILGQARAGQRDQALAELRAVEYSRATARVKNLLAKLYVEVLCAQNPVPGHPDPHPPALATR